ncbi:MAG: hypothetical protein IPP32_12645 [Bacteroidetes bacterium]|nr:hypothetical protein [Bacteroidota bacterium]
MEHKDLDKNECAINGCAIKHSWDISQVIDTKDWILGLSACCCPACAKKITDLRKVEKLNSSDYFLYLRIVDYLCVLS